MRAVCGLDVHKDSVFLCILCETGEIIEKVFGVLTFQLEDMRRLMQSYGVVDVTMELGVLSAEGAVLAALQTVGCVLLVFDRVVVPLLAFIASECDFYSCACSHSFGTSYFIYPRVRALPPCMERRRAHGKTRAKRKPLVRQVMPSIAHRKRKVNAFFL